jgi:hypothetical protein
MKTLNQLLREYFDLLEFPLPLTSDEQARLRELRTEIKNYIKT